MIIEPKVRGFICTTAHPDGCMENVKKQIEYTKNKGKKDGSKKVLIIGSSTGYGLAARIAVTYGEGASTLGVMFEKEATERKTASAGWYNTVAFEEFARKDGYYAKSINGDAFSKEVKDKVIKTIKEDLGKVDMVIYSLAAPKRKTEDGTIYNSTLKTTEEVFTNKSLDLRNNTVVEATIPMANEKEIEDTIKVMGGEDWKQWIESLVEADVIERDAITIAYSYIGPELTYPVYYNGTIGMAKKDLYNTSLDITREFKDRGIKAYISVNKAIVTQASSAIPIVPLYMSILYKVMKEKNIHEGAIEQMNRLFRKKLSNDVIVVDKKNRIRLDDYEMREDVQEQVMEYWNKINSQNINDFADVDGYWNDFYNMFGFKFDNVDYTKDIKLV
ncbi:trans-2-enoyl-CoA reductase family protein [Clostridium bornimense]|uniref:enoyl-ACP reductase FabV n=1 Tax=Clostridium bornimense TaxID=1216932 RepID=UPI001C102DA5|nr:enoyl-ACP reductase FabV [uncultured Clostridium sp.]MBU5317631.1 trans-2-enoyl-CoA reductase family protein [Clostridium bornimense]